MSKLKMSLGRALQAQNNTPSSGSAGTHKELLQVGNIILGEIWENSDGVEFVDVFADAAEKLDNGKWDKYSLGKCVIKTALLPEDLTTISHFQLGQFYRMVEGVPTFTTVPYNSREDADFYEADGVTPIEEKCVPTQVQILAVVLKPTAKKAVARPQMEDNVQRAASQKNSQIMPKQQVEQYFDDEESPF